MTNLDIYLNYSLGPNDIRFLELLYRLPNFEWNEKQTALAIDLHIHKTTVNEMIRRLHKKGLVWIRKPKSSVPITIRLAKKLRGGQNV
jgi:DNA-binding MarR family transcriptional regulator